MRGAADHACGSKHVLNLGIELLLNCNVVEYDGTHVVECTYTGCRTMLAADAIVTVTSRLPNEELALAAAVYACHRHAREFDRPPDDRALFRRELVDLQC